MRRVLDVQLEHALVMRKAPTERVALAVAALVVCVAIHIVLTAFWALVGLAAATAVLWPLDTLL